MLESTYFWNIIYIGKTNLIFKIISLQKQNLKLFRTWIISNKMIRSMNHERERRGEERRGERERPCERERDEALRSRVWAGNWTTSDRTTASPPAAAASAVSVSPSPTASPLHSHYPPFWISFKIIEGRFNYMLRGGRQIKDSIICWRKLMHWTLKYKRGIWFDHFK